MTHVYLFTPSIHSRKQRDLINVTNNELPVDCLKNKTVNK